MYDLSKPFGESCYRLITRTGQFIYLRTRGFLEVDDKSNEVRSFVCVNTLVTEDEGKKLVKEMKKKFSVIIQSNDMLPAIESEVSTVENPQQIEKAVMNLITNLHGPGHEESCQANVRAPSVLLPEDESSTDNADIDDNSSTKGSVHEDNYHSDLDRQTKSPPLAIIAPKPSTIKSSISKSVDVIIAATKNSGSKSPAYASSSTLACSPNDSSDSIDTKTTKRPSVLLKTTTLIATHTTTTTYNLDEHSNRKNILLDRSNTCENIVNLETIKRDCDHYGSASSLNSNPAAAIVAAVAAAPNILPHQIKQEYSSYPLDLNPNNYHSSIYNESHLQHHQHQQQQNQHQIMLSSHQQMQQQQFQQHQQLQPQHYNMYNSDITNPPQSLQSIATKSEDTYYYPHHQHQSHSQRRSLIGQKSQPSLKRGNYMDDYGNDKEKLSKRRMVNTINPNTSIYCESGDDLNDINQGML